MSRYCIRVTQSLLSAVLIVGLSISASSQESIIGSFTLGKIPTSLGSFDATCNGPLATVSITLPSLSGTYEVVGIDIDYEMEALAPGVMADQRSQIYCQNTSTLESSVYEGVGNSPGVYTYSRTDVDIANGTYDPSETLVFEMRAWRTEEGSGCNVTYNFVASASWNITLYYRVCPTGFVQLTSQAAVDSYTSDYGSCSDLPNSLFIGDLAFGTTTDIIDISGLSELQNVGTLNISNNPDLSDLNGLENLASVNSLIIGNCGVADLSALSSLTSVSTLSIFNNPDLASIGSMSEVTELTGSLTIVGNPNLADIDSLAHISAIGGFCAINAPSLVGGIPFISNGTHFGGSVRIQSTPLSDFTGWGQDTVHGDLSLLGTEISSLNGLNGLEVIEGDFVFESIGTSDFTGLNGLKKIDGNCRLRNASLLSSFDGFNNLEQIGDTLELFELQNLSNNSPLLSTPGFNSLQQIGSIEVINCRQFESLGPFPTLQTISNSIILEGNDNLSDASALTTANASLDADVRLRFMGSLDSLDFLSGKDTVRGNVMLSFTPLSDLNGMDSLIEIGGKFKLQNLDSLTSLKGLLRLNGIGDSMIISHNDALSDISQLISINSLGTTEIQGNPQLEVCCVLKNIVPRITSDVLLSGNAEGCNSIFQVKDYCLLIDPDDDGILSDEDNCPDQYNPQQQDADLDSIGNHCDNCPLIPNNDQLDSNDNFIGDACENPEPGKAGLNTNEPASGLEVMSSDIFINDAHRSLIMKNANGECFRLLINIDGALVTRKITCPE